MLVLGARYCAASGQLVAQNRVRKIEATRGSRGVFQCLFTGTAAWAVCDATRIRSFYGDDHRGAIFMPRYDFRPRYTKQAELNGPLWSMEDLPILRPPNKHQRNACVSLTLDLIDWIRTYEVNVIECLGVDYRRQTLAKWDNGKRLFTPAEKIASAWRELSFQVAANFDAFSQKE